MLPAIPAVFAADSMVGSPFPSFENGFTPWDCSELFPTPNSLSPKPVGSSSGSDEPNRSGQTPANSNSSSDEPNQENSNNSGSDDPSRTVSVIDERKRRRMISNRESARRSRMRKQRHLENLRNQVNRLRIENREATNRLRFVLYHCQRVQAENARLRSEHSMLGQKLSNIRQILLLRQLQHATWACPPCNNTMITSTEQFPSLITS